MIAVVVAVMALGCLPQTAVYLDAFKFDSGRR